MRKPLRSALRCEPLPGSAPISAMSQPLRGGVAQPMIEQRELRAAAAPFGNRARAGQMRDAIDQRSSAPVATGRPVELRQEQRGPSTRAFTAPSRA